MLHDNIIACPTLFYGPEHLEYKSTNKSRNSRIICEKTAYTRVPLNLEWWKMEQTFLESKTTIIGYDVAEI